MKRSSRKSRARIEADPGRGSQIDWSSVPGIDPGKLATGQYKFSSPSENRAQERISHRELGFVAFSLREPGGRWLPVRLWDFTSISFGVTYEQADGSWPAPAGLGGIARPEAAEGREAGPDPGSADAAGAPGLRPGDEVQIRVRISPDAEFETWCEVRNLLRVRDGVRIGLRRLDVNFPQAIDIDRRAAFRLPLAPSLSLKARIRHPFLYGHWSALAVSDINRHMGLSFVCADPAILLFEGMEIRIHFELARHRRSALLARVTWVHATGADQVRFGVACMDMPWDLHNGIGDYLLFSRQWTPGRLREAGFLARQVKSRLRFRCAKTMDDYAEVLHLRRDAYVGAGKKPKGTRPEEMAAPLDGHSRILMALHDGKLVGSVAFAFPGSEEEILDSEAGFPGRKFPVRIPPKTSLIEASFLCIDEEYRGTDLLQGLFEHGVKHFLISDRYWLLTSAVGDMLPIFERIGFASLGASHRHPGLGNPEHHLILAHRDAFLMGKGMNLLLWNSLFGDLVSHLRDRKLIKVAGPKALLLRAKLLFGPLAKRLLDRRAARAFGRHLERLRLESARSRPDASPALRAGGMDAGDFLPVRESGTGPA